jgi:uncharacterized protein YlxW (UPF0749 family)
MFLITDLEARPLDPGYAQAAVTKAANPGARRRPWMNTAIICTAVAVGFGAAMSTNALRIPLPDAREARLVLEQQIRTRNEAVTQASERIDALTAEISALQTEVADPSDDLSAATILFDGLGNGTVAVTGPGLVITLTDGGSGGLGEQTVASLVRDSDIQQAVQALWAAGAEAIAVGDQRLTMTTAIRNAGAAVLVDLTPVPGPTFVITAIGDPAQLEAGWVASPAARYFRLLSSEFGINSTVAAWDILAVPARSQNLLHFATPMDREIPQ